MMVKIKIHNTINLLTISNLYYKRERKFKTLTAERLRWEMDFFF